MRPPAAGRAAGLGLLVGWAALTALLLVGLAWWQGMAYWEYSDGVYSLSARELLGGQSVYRDFAAAQPPSLYYAAAGALAVSDTPAAIRVAMALCEACTSLLVLVAVRRLTGSRAAAVCAGAACLVTPWALREHAQLVPETLAAPVIMAAALAGGRRGMSGVAGALGAAAATFKLAFAIPGLAVALMARDVRRSVSGLAAAGAAFAVVFLLVFGQPLWTDVVRAQIETGRAPLRYVSGLWLQAGWNALPLVVLAGLAWPRRRRILDPDLGRSLLGAGLGSLLLLATLLKHGSYLTVMVVAEPPLVCFAACGVVLTLRDWGASSAARRRGRAAVVVGGSALAVAQAASLLASPADPTVFTRPLAASGPGQVLSSAEVGRLVAEIRRCPAGTAYGGPPYLAFVAGRRIAGSQPDQFMISSAPVLGSFRREARTDPAICRSAPAAP